MQALAAGFSSDEVGITVNLPRQSVLGESLKVK
jgi:hypothetical protein